jgi:hypothetical protein
MLNQVTNYMILEDNNQGELEHQVTKQIGKGWVPSGPLVIKDKTLLQVMLKFSK